jgi:hypothetical protein
VARIELNLTRPQRRRVQRAMRQTPNPGFLRRCQIVLNYASDRGCTTTAEVLDCAPATAVRVARRFLKGGLGGLEDRRAGNGDLLRDDDRTPVEGPARQRDAESPLPDSGGTHGGGRGMAGSTAGRTNWGRAEVRVGIR